MTENSRFGMEGAGRTDADLAAVRGLLVVISGPSGVGKDSIVERLIPQLDDAVLFVTATTGQPRPGEIHGRQYFFYSPQEFREEVEKGNFLEWSIVFGEYRGVHRGAVAAALRDHRVVIVKPDPQGMRKLKAELPDALTIFIQASSFEALRSRLVGRGAETPASVEMRMRNAEVEMAAAPEYDHVVINEDGKLDETVEAIANIIRKEAEHPRTYFAFPSPYRMEAMTRQVSAASTGFLARIETAISELRSSGVSTHALDRVRQDAIAAMENARQAHTSVRVLNDAMRQVRERLDEMGPTMLRARIEELERLLERHLRNHP